MQAKYDKSFEYSSIWSYLLIEIPVTGSNFSKRKCYCLAKPMNSVKG